MQSDSLGFLLGDCARLLRRRFDARARALGVSRAQWQVLVALSRQEGVNQAGLAEYLEVETITLCRMADRLQESGLIERRADPADRRAWKLYLTDPARPLLDELRTLGEGVVAEALDGLSPESRVALADGLAAMRANLSARPSPAAKPERPAPAKQRRA
ncbi:MAG: MarR family winged helix-turn-helix transcriptional regulator [Polymorphobacter sp.]